MTSIAPSERFRHELDEALAGVDRDDDPVDTIARLGARVIQQVALKGEVEGFLSRARHERVDEPVRYRNGYEPKTVKTTSGPLALARPRLRKASELGFASRILGETGPRRHALEAFVIGSFLRGLSTRDVKGSAPTTSRLRGALRLGDDARGAEGAARPAARQPRELRGLARLRSRPHRTRAALPRKVIDRFPGEPSALSLIWAVLEFASRGWRGVTMTPKAVAQIERLRRALTAR